MPAACTIYFAMNLILSSSYFLLFFGSICWLGNLVNSLYVYLQRYLDQCVSLVGFRCWMQTKDYGFWSQWRWKRLTLPAQLQKIKRISWTLNVKYDYPFLHSHKRRDATSTRKDICRRHGRRKKQETRLDIRFYKHQRAGNGGHRFLVYINGTITNCMLVLFIDTLYWFRINSCQQRLQLLRRRGAQAWEVHRHSAMGSMRQLRPVVSQVI